MTRARHYRVFTILAATASVVIGMSLLLLIGSTIPARAQQSSTGTTITVNTVEDELTPNPNDGKCSLREAMGNANGNNQGSLDCSAGSGQDTITFAPGVSGTIALSEDLPSIQDSAGLTIDGGNADITISGNHTSKVVEVNPGGALTLKNLTLADGSASVNDNGGAIVNLGTLTVTSSTFSDNYGGNSSGAIDNEGALTVTNSTFSKNSALNGAGAIGNGGTLAVTNSTFSNNGALNGGSIYNSASKVATLRNTILSDSTSGGNCFGTITDGGYNISSDGSCNFSAATSKNDTNPKLASSLANNGGSTETIALLKGSPAINAIPKGQSSCATTTDPITTDQRGVTRPQGTACDIGAYEKKRKRHH